MSLGKVFGWLSYSLYIYIYIFIFWVNCYNSPALLSRGFRILNLLYLLGREQAYLVGGFNPSEKYATVKSDLFTKDRDEHKKCLKPPPSLVSRKQTMKKNQGFQWVLTPLKMKVSCGGNHGMIQ